MNYTYKCEICKKEFEFDEPKQTPYFIPHVCKLTCTEGLQEDMIIDCGGALYRVWQPIPFYVKGAE